jgi:hypothetical protein
MVSVLRRARTARDQLYGVQSAHTRPVSNLHEPTNVVWTKAKAEIGETGPLLEAERRFQGRRPVRDEEDEDKSQRKEI